MSRPHDRDGSIRQLGNAAAEIPPDQAAAAARVVRRRDAERGVPSALTDELLAMLGVDEVLAG